MRKEEDQWLRGWVSCLKNNLYKQICSYLTHMLYHLDNNKYLSNIKNAKSIKSKSALQCHHVYIRADTSPDAVCRHAPSPASPHRCTHKADMAQPENNKNKHSYSHPVIMSKLCTLKSTCCHFIVHTNCSKLSVLVNFNRWMSLLSDICEA